MGSEKLFDGTLSQEDFYVSAMALCEKWKKTTSTLPQWTWVPGGRSPIGASCNEEGYLSLENVYRFDLNEGSLGEQSFHKEEEPDDNATLICGLNEETHIYNFHIVYSFSYKVPVLYFRGYEAGGQPLSLEDVEKNLPEYSLRLRRESKWTFITQEEHPFLHRPWYTLHPCGTNDWMKLLLGGTLPSKPEIVSYLPSWLSVVGQAVGLRIPRHLHDNHAHETK